MVAESPSSRIVAELRRRIRSGELTPGDRVPSARQITAEWGVAIATATKVLAALQSEGLVRAVPGVGTVVSTVDAARPAAPAPAVRATRRRDAGAADGGLTRERIAEVAIRVADSEGMAALSMRRVATDLDLPTMSLYRYVRSKEELILLMIDIVFTDCPPPTDAGDWRSRIEALLRVQWTACRQHPWIARAISFTRPLMAPNAMDHTEYALQALEGLGLDPTVMIYVVLAVTGFTVGTAVNLELEAEAEQDTGVTSSEWMEERDPAFEGLTASGRFPQLRRLSEIPDFDIDLDALFEFGLTRMLDGLAVFIANPTPIGLDRRAATR
jgi:AcrR family transcriptional regulator